MALGLITNLKVGSVVRGRLTARRKIAFIGALLLTLAASGTFAEISSVTLISGGGAAHQKVVQKLGSALGTESGLAIAGYDLATLKGMSSPPAALENNELFVTVGTGAAVYVADNFPRAAALNVLVTSQSHSGVTERLDPERHRFFGLTIDQPFERYLSLVRRLLPKAKKMSVLGLPSALKADVDAAFTAGACGLELQGVTMAASDNPIRLLDRVFSASDVLLALPQPGSADANSAKWVLYAGSRHRKPVIGFSAKYVKAGALAAVFTSTDDIAEETSAIIRSWNADGIPAHPWSRPGEHFTVKTNPKVAHFLRLQVPDETSLYPEVAGVGAQSSCMLEVAN